MANAIWQRNFRKRIITGLEELCLSKDATKLPLCHAAATRLICCFINNCSQNQESMNQNCGDLFYPLNTAEFFHKLLFLNHLKLFLKFWQGNCLMDGKKKKG